MALHRSRPKRPAKQKKTKPARSQPVKSIAALRPGRAVDWLPVAQALIPLLQGLLSALKR